MSAGRLENNETLEAAAKRKLLEETGICFEDSQMQRLNSLYIRKPQVDDVYHLFKVQLNGLPKVHLSNKHQSYKWANSKDIEEMDLMDGAKEALNHY